MGIPRRNAGNEKQGAWSVRDRGGGTSSPAPRAPTPRGDIPTVQCTASPRLHPGYGCSPDIATHCPRPAGEGAERRRRGRGGAGKEQGVWSVRDRGGGKRPPSPSASPPMAISTTVHCMGISRERPGYGFPPGIATHCHRPAGEGAERRRRGRGGGCQQKCMGSLLAKARVGWRVPAEVYG